MSNRSVSTAIFITATFVSALSACSTTTHQAAPTSYDGLTLVPNTKFQQVYRRPDADMNEYKELGLAPCKVAFKKNWMRDQNSTRINLSSRVTQQDVDKIKDSLGELCDEQFRAALQEDPSYTLVDSFDDGEHVLVLHPSIINLDINAPDISSPDRTRTYTTSSGEMTLFLEMSDATTGETLARAIDKRRGLDENYLQWSNSISNRADAKRVLKRWANILREALDEARAN